MGSYKLDPLHYYTAPGLSWDALLKYTNINLKLLTDIDMHMFIEKGMCGGISMVSKKQKPIILILRIVTQRKTTTTSCTMMQTISMAGR